MGKWEVTLFRMGNVVSSQAVGISMSLTLPEEEIALPAELLSDSAKIFRWRESVQWLMFLQLFALNNSAFLRELIRHAECAQRN